MGLINQLERLMAMDDAAWARHANPWSGWTRLPILPLLALSIWARMWIGWWCLLPVALLIAWTFWNPRAFPPPSSTESWMSRVTFGERIWLNAHKVPIPTQHAVVARRLSAVALAGLVPLTWGLWVFEIWAVLLGLALSMGPKLWQMDRMVWLHQDMKHANKTYDSWMR
jgi:polyferredoxin